jgi:hypothetical protein
MMWMLVIHNSEFSIEWERLRVPCCCWTDDGNMTSGSNIIFYRWSRICVLQSCLLSLVVIVLERNEMDKCVFLRIAVMLRVIRML